MGGLFTRDELLEALDALTDELIGRGVTARIQIVGGSAIALVYDFEFLSTRDVDAALGPNRDAIKEAALAVSATRGYAEDWLNDKAELFIPVGGDHDWTTLIQRQGVRISVASGSTLLAMKLRAGRPNRDFGHIQTLIAACRLETAADVIALYQEHYPGDALKPLVEAWLQNRYP